MATLSLMTFTSPFIHRHKWLQLQQHHSPHEFSRFRVSSINKTRKVKTNAELCEDIREFVAATGLPEGYVPTMKDFSQHGRSDLAYVVRRRGYKVIGELLGSAKETGFDGSGVEKAGENKFEEPKTIVSEDSVEVLSMGNRYDILVMNSDVESEGKEDIDGGAEMVNVSAESANSLRLDGETLQNGRNESYNTVEEVAMPSVPEELSVLSLEEKAAGFIHHGNLDTDEATERNIEQVEADEVQMATSSSTQLQNVLSGGNTATNFNGTTLQSLQVVTAMTGNNLLRDGNLSVEQQSTQFSKVVKDKTSNGESYIEVNHLKFMLDEKELELSRLREEIEKEKCALALLQAKAETEIKKAQKLISEKDAELQVAEEMLSELVEVLIQYRGDGEVVEVAGSFNGWHHWVKMDPQPSSNDEDNVESRNSKLWSTVLWLYPGIYEIKFIVDGQWKNDPTKELVSHGDICNNILRALR